jgi:hypothetical protein
MHLLIGNYYPVVIRGFNAVSIRPAGIKVDAKSVGGILPLDA